MPIVIDPDKPWEERDDDELGFADLRAMSAQTDPAVKARAARILREQQAALKSSITDFNRRLLDGLKPNLIDVAAITDSLRVSHQRADAAEAKVAEIQARPTHRDGDVLDTSGHTPELLEALNELTAANRTQLDAMLNVMQGVLAQTLAVNGQLEALNVQVGALRL